MANGYLQQAETARHTGIDDVRAATHSTPAAGTTDTPATDLAGLSDKRVGIIGTGATAIQCVPRLAGPRSSCTSSSAPRQRSTCGPTGRPNPSGPASLEPGWQQRRMENFQILTAGGQADEDLVDDAWTSLTKKLPIAAQRHRSGPSTRPRELADFAKMEEIRARVDEIVADPATAEALKPWYGYYCKRPCFHDEYLQAFNRDNVTLVDTHGEGVERITEAGVVVDGVEYPLDCLIFATGFEVGTNYSRRTGFEVIGRDGLTLTEQVGRRRAHAAWPARQRLSQLLHRKHRPVRLHREFPVPDRHPGAPHRLGDRLGAEARRHRVEATADAEAAGSTPWWHGRCRSPAGARPVPPATTTVRARPRQDATRTASSSAVPPNTPTSSSAWREAGTLDGLDLTG